VLFLLISLIDYTTYLLVIVKGWLQVRAAVEKSSKVVFSRRSVAADLCDSRHRVFVQAFSKCDESLVGLGFALEAPLVCLHDSVIVKGWLQVLVAVEKSSKGVFSRRSVASDLCDSLNKVLSKCDEFLVGLGFALDTLEPKFPESDRGNAPSWRETRKGAM
jgi:hypothetical protein